ncbi:MAG: 3'(2'),5'-bisphosphate nucleotidase CysQ, partial [Candidatus Heimdallarchaeaceae archaeon]
PERLDKDKVWIVDPIDGTREFVESIPEYAISVALVEKGQPVIGVVLNPLKDELYSAIKGEGAYLNGEPIHVNSKLDNKPVIVASRSENKRGEWEDFKQVAEVIPTGSIAYKLALVAAGTADATFSLCPKNEWDIAAGHLLVEEAGGVVSDKYGQCFIYNQKETLVDSIVGISKVASKTVFKMIEKSRNKNG